MFGLNVSEVTQVIEKWFVTKGNSFKNEVLEKVTEILKEKGTQLKTEVISESNVILSNAQEILHHAQAVNLKSDEVLQLCSEAISSISETVNLVDYVKQNVTAQTEFVKRAATAGVQQQERFNQILDRLEKIMEKRMEVIEAKSKKVSTVKTKK